MTEKIEIYRVRKSFKDIKSQKGAYFSFNVAVKKARKYGLNVYDWKGKLLYKGKRRNIVNTVLSHLKKRIT